MFFSENKDEDAQLLKMNNERFMVPELLFNPSDIGINEMGIAEALVHSVVKKCPEGTDTCSNFVWIS